MSQADTPPVIKPYTGQLQDQDEKGSLPIQHEPIFQPQR
jgi:hypothetical protein